VVRGPSRHHGDGVANQRARYSSPVHGHAAGAYGDESENVIGGGKRERLTSDALVSSDRPSRGQILNRQRFGALPAC